MIQNRVVGAGSDRKQGIEVLKKEAAVLKCEFNFAGIEGLAEGTSQHRQKNSAVETARVGMPFDIEEGGVGGLGAIFEDIHPPRIFGAGGHVIGNGVEEETHAAILQFGLQGGEVLFAAKIGIDPRGIGHVISVTASLSAG